jgi:hypothetical protein
MTEHRPTHAQEPRPYEIVVRGELSARFDAAFGGMTIRTFDGCTHIVGEVIDQSQLHGVLERLRSLGIELISVVPLIEDASTAQSCEAPKAREPPR